MTEYKILVIDNMETGRQHIDWISADGPEEAEDIAVENNLGADWIECIGLR